jgi:putative ABC transport system permease protein
VGILPISYSLHLHNRMNRIVLENIYIALRAIKGQLLRTSLTVMIIAVGITALVGILTAIDAIKQSINSNFTSMGANTFTIRNKGQNVRIGKGGGPPKVYPQISYAEAARFKTVFNNKATTSISGLATFSATVKHGSEKSNPNISVFGADENYLLTMGYQLSSGRNFSSIEQQNAANVVIMGGALARNLFKGNIDPVGKIVSIGSNKYLIIGILKEKGASMGFGGDQNCIIPINNMRQYFSRPDLSYVINVLSPSADLSSIYIDEAIGIFRVVRKVDVFEEENFEVIKSDNLANILIENLKYVTVAATIIGFITLLGAAVGLMNIMLVAVSERTREIGIRKAIGANQKMIKQQFLTEAIVICQLGGLLGIILGILIGNAISMLVEGGFIIPWSWILFGLIICYIVGLFAGIYPANKAAKLDPIEALRTE